MPKKLLYLLTSPPVHMRLAFQGDTPCSSPASVAPCTMPVTDACFCICDFSWPACRGSFCLIKLSCTFQLASHCWGHTLASWSKQLLLLPLGASRTHPCRSASHSPLSVLLRVLLTRSATTRSLLCQHAAPCMSWKSLLLWCRSCSAWPYLSLGNQIVWWCRLEVPEGCPGYCRICSRSRASTHWMPVACYHPPCAPAVTTRMSPHIAKCPRRGVNHSWSRTTMVICLMN